jgi:hypothetical protein
MPETTAEYLRAKAAKARRLASALPAEDPTGLALLDLAAQYDAAALEADLIERGRPC